MAAERPAGGPSRERRPWIGSVGYERFPDSAVFARHLRRSGVERLVDVRELPISRRRGYAKGALTETLADAGIEYIHMRGLGNPKAIRDLWKAGEVEEGRRLYETHLLSAHREQLSVLRSLVEEKPTALMCLEHEQAACHRDVILEALCGEHGDSLEIRDLGVPS